MFAPFCFCIGTIPKTLANISTLTDIHLYHNGLTGIVAVGIVAVGILTFSSIFARFFVEQMQTLMSGESCATLWCRTSLGKIVVPQVKRVQGKRFPTTWGIGPVQGG